MPSQRVQRRADASVGRRDEVAIGVRHESDGGSVHRELRAQAAAPACIAARDARQLRGASVMRSKLAFKICYDINMLEYYIRVYI